MSKKRFLALTLAAAMVVSAAPAISANAEELSSEATTEETVEITDVKNTYHDIDIDVDICKDVNLPGLYNANKASIPSSWDSRKKGMITSVKDQNPYGSCWTFAAMGSLEAAYKSTKKKTLDLSEYQTAYFFYNRANDPLGLTAGDKNKNMTDNYLDQGGNSILTLFSLASWSGAVDESKAPYSKATPTSKLSSTLAYNSDKLHMQNSDIVSMQDPTNVKTLIMKYGGLAVSVNMDGNYMNTTTHALYDPSNHNTNHAVMVVGWDDNYSKSNFAPYKPNKNGAWLIKNSWGAGSANYDFFWVSYADKPLLNSEAVSFVGEDASNYKYNYQYDGSASGVDVSFKDNITLANVYTVKGAAKEKLQAVGIGLFDDNIAYTVSIYKNPKTGNPKSGTKVHSQTGTIKYQGYHTIKLNKSITFNKGDKFAVVFDLHDTDNDYNVVAALDGTVDYGWVSFTSKTAPNQSYAMMGSTVLDLSSANIYSNVSNYCARIKAYTNPVSTSSSAPKTSIKSVKAGSKSFTVKWAKKTGIKGYQVQYSTSSSFKGAKTKTITKASTTSKKITNLKAKKKYYVRVRTFKVENGKKVYSDWSAKKSVKTK